MQETDDGGVAMEIQTKQKHVFQMKILKSNIGNQRFDMYFQRKDKQQQIFRKKVELEAVDQTISDALSELFQGSEEIAWQHTSQKPVEFSSKIKDSKDKEKDMKSPIKIALVKNTLGDDTSIELTNISASKDVLQSSIFATIDAVMSSPEFVGKLPQNAEAWYEVTDIGDQLDVHPCEECEGIGQQTALQTMRRCAYNALFDLQFFSWNSTDQEVRRIYCEQFRWALEDQARRLGELEVEVAGCAAYTPDLIQGIAAPSDCMNMDESTVRQIIMNDLTEYVVTLEMYTCLFDKDIQLVLLTWLRDWKHTLKYELGGSLASDTLTAVFQG